MNLQDMNHEGVELVLWLENDQAAHRGYLCAAARNLERHYKAGRFDFEKGCRGMRHAVDQAARRYHLEHGSPWCKWSSVFDVATRDRVAEYFAEQFVESVRVGDRWWQS